MNQGIGVANYSTGFTGEDGILGLGPVDLTANSVVGVASIPTYIQTLKSDKLVPSAAIGIAFAPITTYDGNPVKNGVLTLGGVDTNEYTGSLLYVPLTTVYPASYYWGMQIDAFTYTSIKGKRTALTTSPAARTGIVDTGTTLLLLPSDAFNTYMNALTGSFIDPSTGLLLIPKSSLNTIGNLTLTIGGRAFTLIAAAQLFPPAIGSEFASSDYAVSIVGDAGSTDSGDDFTLGMYFLQRFYSVYDTGRSRIGFATTKNTYTKTTTIKS